MDATTSINESQAQEGSTTNVIKGKSAEDGPLVKRTSRRGVKDVHSKTPVSTGSEKGEREWLNPSRETARMGTRWCPPFKTGRIMNYFIGIRGNGGKRRNVTERGQRRLPGVE